MAQYLLELFTEEIPARMQANAAQQLKERFEEKLGAEGLTFELLETFVTPRRLGIAIQGLPRHQNDRTEEKKGPRVGSDPKALEGFLMSTGATLETIKEKEIPGKGTFYFFQQKIQAKSIEGILTAIVSSIIQEFLWPKSMHWASYNMTWVRPLRSILSLLDDKVLPVMVEDPNVIVGKNTHGHRFLSPEIFMIKDFNDYKNQLNKHYVMVDAEERAKTIMDQLHHLADGKDLTLKEDAALLQEVRGLVEWPVALLGKIDDRFMTLPPEVLETTMKTHQKYFSLLNQNGTPAPYFGVISNMTTIDQGAQIVEGNERVLRARLADAEFFWTQDQKKSLDIWAKGLDTLIFHEKIGSVGDRIKRVTALAPSCVVGNNDQVTQAQRAACLAKADLLTGMVGEFPELQGIMGGYYAARAGENPAVAQAIREHYSPLGPSDTVPTAPVSVALALADKIDVLVSFWAAGIEPTGSKDPYALRRSALGVIRFIIENNMALSLRDLFSKAYDLLPTSLQKSDKDKVLQSLETFMVNRLKVFFKGLGFESGPIEAVLSKKWDGHIQQAHQVLKALGDFLKTDLGQDLMTTYKRISNSVDQAIRSGIVLNGLVDPELFEGEEEKILFDVIKTFRLDVEGFLKQQLPHYEGVMSRLATLRPYADAFFDKVTVQAEDMKVRTNRLNLLYSARTLMDCIADFSLIPL